MKVGMMWLDNDKKRTLDEKVRRAADYYRDKYGRFPELCLVNSRVLKDEKKVSLSKDTDIQSLAKKISEHEEKLHRLEAETERIQELKRKKTAEKSSVEK